MEITKQNFEEFSRQLDEPDWFTSYRLSSFQKIDQTVLPSFKYGLAIRITPDFNFTTLTPLSKPDVETHIKGEGIESYSSNQISKDFEGVHKERFEEFLTDAWKEPSDENTLFYFHQAFTNDFLLIRIPEGKVIEEPIEIQQILKKGPVVSTICILAEKNSKVKILLTKHTDGDVSYISEDVRILAKENSKVDFISIQDIGKETTNVQKRRSLGKKDSSVNWMDVCLGTKYTKSDVISSLDEEGASTNNRILFLCNGTQQYDLYTAALHNAPHTSSDMVTKGVLNHQAKALSRGLVKIGEHASGSNGYETQDALLLSDEAEADAIPNLEIHNHDVKCSHGSTVGQVDAEKLFYLMSRGLNEEEAKQKIVEGYFTPVLSLFADERMREKIRQSITSAMS